MATYITKKVNGSVSGPDVATDNAIPRFDGADGQNVKASGVIIDNSDNILAPSEIFIQGLPIKATIESLSGGGSGYVLQFNNTSDWTLNGADYEITVLATTHLKGTNPDCEVFELSGGSYKVVEVGEFISNTGDVTIKILSSPDLRFAGKLIIQ